MFRTEDKNTAHFLIPVEYGEKLRPRAIISDVNYDKPFDWLGHTVDPSVHTTWLHYLIQADTEELLNILVDAEIAKLDAIESPYYMLYMDGK